MLIVTPTAMVDTERVALFSLGTSSHDDGTGAVFGQVSLFATLQLVSEPGVAGRRILTATLEQSASDSDVAVEEAERAGQVMLRKLARHTSGGTRAVTISSSGDVTLLEV
jgi:hypothetical protein